MIDWVQDRNRDGFPVGKVELWRGVEDSEGVDSHCGPTKRDNLLLNMERIVPFR
jgi:hypothetical protein